MSYNIGLKRSARHSRAFGKICKKFPFKLCCILRVKRGRGIAAGGSHEVRNPKEL